MIVNKYYKPLLILFLVTVISFPVQASLNFGILPDDASIPLIVAREKGLFKETGYDINLVPFNTAIERDSALQVGEIDGTVADIVAAAFAVDNGKKLKITSRANGRFTMLAAPDSGISSYEELKNAKIAISSNTVIEYLTDKFFEKNGYDYSNLKKVAIPKIPVRVQMLAASKVQAATMPEPLASLAVSKGAKIIETTNELGGAPIIIMFTQQAIDDKPQEVQAFYEAYNKAVNLVNENHEDYRDLIVNKGRFPASVKNAFEFSEYEEAHLPTKSMLVEVMEWMKDNNLLTSNLDYNELVTDQFVE